MKIGLVLEGGAMRGMFTAGVLDTFLDNDIKMDSVVGVSAGALFGVNYLSGQKGRVIRYNKRFNKDKNYMGFRPLLREGNIVSTKYAYEDVPKTLDPFDAGTYTLYVFSEQYNGDYMTDYASALQEISLNVLPKEATPQAAFTAAGDSSGTLSNVDASMKYSTDGGASWTDITGTTAEITGVTADMDIQVVKKGDSILTEDSDAQIIDVTQAAIPVGIGKTDCTTAAQNDGTITGVDSTMEYRLSTASEWTSISGNTVSGLANGTYDVRVKANGTVLASEVATVTIGAHTCAAQGGWHSDETGHWNTCECGEKLNEAAHTFEWVIDKEATAAEAGSKHEECTVCGYAKAAVEIPATGEITSPETGDDSNITLWIVVMLAAGIALTGTILYSRKRKYSK